MLDLVGYRIELTAPWSQHAIAGLVVEQRAIRRLVVADHRWPLGARSRLLVRRHRGQHRGRPGIASRDLIVGLSGRSPVYGTALDARGSRTACAEKCQQRRPSERSE